MSIRNGSIRTRKDSNVRSNEEFCMSTSILRGTVIAVDHHHRRIVAVAWKVFFLYTGLVEASAV